MKKGFAQRLRSLREGFGISQLRLGNALGAQQSYVAKWEAEAYDPSGELKERIAQFFQVSPEWLVDGVGPVFRGIVFVPMSIHMSRGRFNVDRWMTTAMLVVGDGAFVDRVAVNADHEDEAVLLFARGRDLRLFMHFGTLSRSLRGSSGGPGVAGLMETIADRSWTGGGSPDIFRVPENAFRLISPLSGLEGIERLLSTTIPAELKEACAGGRLDRRTRIGDLIRLVRDEARRELKDRDFDNSACTFLLSIEDEGTLKGILFLVPDLMKCLNLSEHQVANLSMADLKRKVLDFCEGSCGW